MACDVLVHVVAAAAVAAGDDIGDVHGVHSVCDEGYAALVVAAAVAVGVAGDGGTAVVQPRIVQQEYSRQWPQMIRKCEVDYEFQQVGLSTDIEVHFPAC